MHTEHATTQPGVRLPTILIALFAAVGLVFAAMGSASPVSAEEHDTGTITVIKTNEDDEPLAGVGFTLFDAECETAISNEGFTGDDGTLDIIEVAAPGEYCLVESTPAQGYNVLEPLAVTLTAEEPTVEVPVVNTVAEDLTGTITVVKTDEDEDPLTGVGFTLFDSECDTAISNEGFTGDDGTLDILEVAVPGEYCLVESTPAEGFNVLDPLAVELTVEEPNVTLPIVNTAVEQATGTITVVKTNADGGALQGVGFTLFDSECDAAISNEGFTGADGRLAIVQVAVPGEYCLVESDPAEGFHVLDPLAVRLTAEQPNVEVPVVNTAVEQPTGTITVVKTDANGTALRGVGFTLFNAECDTAISNEGFTGADGRLDIVQVAVPGTYCLVESDPAEGYNVLDPLAVSLTDARPDVEVPIVNTAVRSGTLPNTSVPAPVTGVAGIGAALLGGAVGGAAALMGRRRHDGR